MPGVRDPLRHVVIAKILGRRAAPLPKDWDVLGDWLNTPAKAVNQASGVSNENEAAAA